MARILILSLVFSPDGVSTAVLVSELAYDLQARGHLVTVLTTQPHYNVDMDARAQQPLRKRWGGLFYQSSYHGIPVWHTAMRPKGKSRVVGRIVDYMIFHTISAALGIVAIGQQDIVFAVSPPLTIGLVGWFLAVIKRARLIYNVQELYPATAVRMGILKAGSRLTRMLEWFERFIYKRPSALAVICEPFAVAIEAKGIDRRAIHVIPNFVDTEFARPGPKANPLAAELGLESKFVVLYAGNIGMTQSFDTLLETARRLQVEPGIVFLIVGDGARRAEIEAQAREQRLANVRLLPYQPRSRVPDIYATADLCLVPLMAGTAQTTVPSKLYTIMASGRPALVAVDEDSDLTQTVIKARCGITVPPDDADALEKSIRSAFENPSQLKTYGENGRVYAEQNLSRRMINDRYHQLIESLT